MSKFYHRFSVDYSQPSESARRWAASATGGHPPAALFFAYSGWITGETLVISAAVR